MELNTKRNDHMRLSLWQEFEYLHANKACIGIMYTNYISTMSRFSEKYSELWKRLLTLVNEVPTNGFMK